MALHIHKWIPLGHVYEGTVMLNVWKCAICGKVKRTKR
jgi:hypothetical protein